jgi:STE24 endopeptidase
MTATRIAGRWWWWRAATVVVLAAVWAVAAWLLWRTRVPGNLALPHVDPHAYFSSRQLARAASYERFGRIDFLLSTLALLGALAVYARKGAVFARESAAGPIGTGMLLGMLAFGVVWIAQLPFGVADLWWDRRHGVSREGYFSWIVASFVGLGGAFLFICLAILIVMGFATLLGRRWWLVGAPAFVGLAVLFALVQPWLMAPSTHAIRNARVTRDARLVAAREGIPGTKVVVENVHNETSSANAFAAGIGPSRRVTLWDTLLDGRFTERQIRFVLAHEFGHLKRNHIWKALAWYALFALPGAYFVTRSTRRRGGLHRPEAIPLALFVLVLLQTLALPLQNVISRHMESEADWMALQTTRDPSGGAALFQRFGTTSLQQPDPPTWAYLLLENHPTLMQRIAMTKAWKLRNRNLTPAGF